MDFSYGSSDNSKLVNYLGHLGYAVFIKQEGIGIQKLGNTEEQNKPSSGTGKTTKKTQAKIVSLTEKTPSKN